MNHRKMAKLTEILKSLAANYRQIKVNPSLNLFLLQYMKKIRVIDIGGNLVIHSHLPPLKSKAYSRFVNEYLSNKTNGPSHAQIGLTNARNILSLMIKLADVSKGSISGKEVDKTLTDQDKKHLQQGVDLCSKILEKLGTKKQDLFLGTLNAGHPGGMLPLTEKEAKTFHHSALPENLYVADATLISKSLGNPPILTIIAIAKRASKLIRQKIS